MSSDNHSIYVGNIVTGGRNDEQLVKASCLRFRKVVKNDQIIARGAKEEILEKYDGEIIQLEEHQILAPGYVDGHLHAPQFKMSGMYLDRPLLDWLKAYTFPTETRFAKVEYAEKVYPHVISSTLEAGTTTASYFDSIYTDAAMVLANQALTQGQRAMIGKCNIDINDLSPTYKEASTEESYRNKFFIKTFLTFHRDYQYKLFMRETVRMVQTMQNMTGYKNMVEPIITPRFALSCTISLMKALGQLAKEHDLPVQSHINENLTEVEIVATLKPYSDFKHYCDVYEDCGLFGPRCLYAHSIWTTKEEYKRMAATGTSVIHCPDSNFQLMSGFFDAKFTDEMGINIGLGTDVGASGLVNMADQVHMAERVSKCRAINDKADKCYVSFRQAYDWATMGGAKALGLGDKIGSLDVGKKFDALVVDISDFPDYITEDETIDQLFERYVRMGSKQNVVQVFVDGIQRIDKTK